MKQKTMPRAFVCVIALIVPSAFAQPRPTTRPTATTRPAVSWVNPKLPGGPGLSHHVLKSKTLGHDVGYVIWTPAGYDEKAEQRYPVIYFLHGSGGNESGDSGGFSGQVAQAIQKGVLPPVICVFPNGGMSGYRGEVEMMIVDELIPLVDQSYRTIAKAESRAVAGFSMGGAGATRLIIAHPDLFCAAAGWGGGGRVGDATLAANAETIKKNKIAFFAVKGDHDRPEDAQAFAKELDKLGIENQLIILENTDHNLGLYYQRSAPQMMEFLGKHIRAGSF
jgi:predicted alpha/beta superfamily hydrolase